MTSPDVKEVSGKSFDCIVVGGGTAGRPLAATLSERLSVILDAIPNIRGIVLGGSSAISDRFYSRSSQDFVKKVWWDGELGTKLGGSIFDECGKRYTSADPSIGREFKQ
ncbi:hypothetical protein FEM48_Zijuj10G0083500 [Ziziphus jujuba var. spinosa]|uniref:Uncharacterized protein n=1 Tax=Ziziphus jujuba var. spinosa TaxID=714518 RepID=A0A978UMA6_ZIZJJ|nr:hypothetical protein FEM48_Zijuj10G0083500 [Ziziphus jujuba var. spinosa]